MKRNIISLILTAALLCATIGALGADASEETIHVLLNGKAVEFTEETGYPYVDENFRTMVPLRATMESAGFAVGYDGEKQTAIVITDHNRIEVPIGTNILYQNNVKLENDTEAVAKNGRTYLPIRAVLEAAGYTVEWEPSSGSVVAYSYAYDEESYVPYHTSDLATLAGRVLSGDVVYLNGGYYATPEFWKLLNTVEVHYSGEDLNRAIYPQADSRYDLAELDLSDCFSDETTTGNSLTGLSGEVVWIPTHGGTKYHSSPSCSNMIDPIAVDLTEALQQGFDACKRCY